MNGAVVYYSRWGHCKWVAEEIVGGLREAGHNASLLDVRSFVRLDPVFDFLAFGCSMRGARLPGPACRFIKRLDSPAWKEKPFAAFSTGLVTDDGDPEFQAATAILKALTVKGLRPVAPPFNALLLDIKGPVVKGELLRALWFGKQLGAILNNIEGKEFEKVSWLDRDHRTRYSPSSREKRRRAS